MRARTALPALALIAALAACAATPPAPTPPPPQPPAARKPVFATAGWVKPQEAQAGCVARAFQPPSAWRAKGKVTAKVAVDPAGRVERFEDVSEPADPSGALSAALERAVAACAFVPGRAPDGRPATIWLLMTVPAPAPARR